MGMNIYSVNMYGIKISEKELIDRIIELQSSDSYESYKYLFYDEDGELLKNLDSGWECADQYAETIVENIVSVLNKNQLGYKFTYMIDVDEREHYIGSGYEDMSADMNRREFETYINKTLYDIFNVKCEFQSDKWIK